MRSRTSSVASRHDIQPVITRSSSAPWSARMRGTHARCCIIAAVTRNSSASNVLTPRRHRGVEPLDDPRTDPATRERSLRDVRVSNVLLGGRRAVLSELARVLPRLGTDVTLLDVGTGLADIPSSAAGLASRRGGPLLPFSGDEAQSLARPHIQTLAAKLLPP